MTATALKPQSIRFITTEDAGEPCWYYVKVNAESLTAFDAASASAGFDPRGYGAILESGQGEHPSQDVISFMEEEYGFITR